MSRCCTLGCRVLDAGDSCPGALPSARLLPGSLGREAPRLGRGRAEGGLALPCAPGRPPGPPTPNPRRLSVTHLWAVLVGWGRDILRGHHRQSGGWGGMLHRGMDSHGGPVAGERGPHG